MEVLSEVYSNSTRFCSSNSSFSHKQMQQTPTKKIQFTPFDNSSRSQSFVYDLEINELRGQDDEDFLNLSNDNYSSPKTITDKYNNDKTFSASKFTGFSSAIKTYGLKKDINQENVENSTQNKQHNQPTTFTDFISHVNRSKIKQLCSPRNKPTKTFISQYKEKIFSILSIDNSFSFIEDNQIKFPYPNQVGSEKGKKKIIFFDIDKVLLQCFFGGDYYESDDVIEIKLLSRISVKVGITLRPMIRETLKELKEHFFLCIYSTCDEMLGEALINFLDFDGSLFTLRLYRSKCHTFKISRRHVYVKDLRIIQEVSVKDMLIIDTNSLSAGLQPSNVIPVTPFSCTKNNKDLSSLIPQLKQLATKDDMRTGNDQCLPLRRKKASTVKLNKSSITKASY